MSKSILSYLFIILCLLIMCSCANDVDTALSELSSEQVIDKFVEALKSGSKDEFKQLFSEDFLSKSDFDVLKPENIYDVKIKPLNFDDLNFDKEKEPNTEYFVLDCHAVAPQFFSFGIAGDSAVTRFIEIIVENGSRKINEINTSP